MPARALRSCSLGPPARTWMAGTSPNEPSHDEDELAAMPKGTFLHSRRARAIAAGVFVVAALMTGWFGLRSYGSFLVLRSAHAAGAPMTSSIRGWMTLDYVAANYRTP